MPFHDSFVCFPFFQEMFWSLFSSTLPKKHLDINELQIEILQLKESDLFNKQVSSYQENMANTYCITQTDVKLLYASVSEMCIKISQFLTLKSKLLVGVCLYVTMESSKVGYVDKRLSQFCSDFKETKPVVQNLNIPIILAEMRPLMASLTLYLNCLSL